MSDYKQPSFYRFNQDSLDLVRWIKNKNKNKNPLHVLDLGAGVGIIGLELAQHYQLQKLTLVELQKEFLPYIEENLKHFLSTETLSEVIISSFADFNAKTTWDMIVCNPPYFLPGHGQISEDVNKSLARSFLVDDWKILLKCIERHLSAEGVAYIVVRKDKTIFNEIKNAIQLTKLQISFEEENKLYFIALALIE